jgi:hypothetical protein
LGNHARQLPLDVICIKGKKILHHISATEQGICNLDIVKIISFFVALVEETDGYEWQAQKCHPQPTRKKSEACIVYFA